MISNFNYYTPTEVCFGKDTQALAGEKVKKYGGTQVLVVYGSERVRKNGLMDTVIASLEKENISYELLGGVVPNPHLEKVYEGIEIGRKNNTDFLLAVGGGSVIDTAKAIAYGLAEPQYDVWELYDHTRVPKKSLPIGTVLTIAAAGSEMSDSSVITNEKTQEKRGVNNDLCRPKFAIMNPELTFGLPDYQTESGCADICMHTMERYFTNGGKMEITDALAEGLMKTVMAQAEILHRDPDNYEARAEVMWAGSLAHNNLTGCGNSGNDFATHRLEHEMGGLFDVTHGAGLAAIWSSWARYVMDNAMPRFVRFATNVMDVQRTADMSDKDVALAGIEAMEAFYHRIGMPTNMEELGISPTAEQIEWMADSCMRATGGGVGSAKKLVKEDMIAIYKMACGK